MTEVEFEGSKAYLEGYGDFQDGDVRDQPEHWLNVINLEPTKGNLQQLAQELAQRPVGWIDEYIELRGVVALMDLLELLEKRTSKKAVDFELMDQVLRCLRSLMNLERGMKVILGLDEMDEVRAAPRTPVCACSPGPAAQRTTAPPCSVRHASSSAACRPRRAAPARQPSCSSWRCAST